MERSVSVYHYVLLAYAPRVKPTESNPTRIDERYIPVFLDFCISRAKKGESWVGSLSLILIGEGPCRSEN